MCIRDCLSILLTLLALSASDGQTGRTTPALQYDKPSGFAAAPVTHRPAFADSLDGVIHVYPFRPVHGDLADQFQRTLFRDWILAPYRGGQTRRSAGVQVAERERGSGGGGVMTWSVPDWIWNRIAFLSHQRP